MLDPTMATYIAAITGFLLVAVYLLHRNQEANKRLLAVVERQNREIRETREEAERTTHQQLEIMAQATAHALAQTIMEMKAKQVPAEAPPVDNRRDKWDTVKV